MNFESMISELDVKALKRQRDAVLAVVMCPDKHKLSDTQIKNMEPVVDMMDTLVRIKEEMITAYEETKKKQKRTIIGKPDGTPLAYDKITDLSYKRKGDEVMVYLMEGFVGYAKVHLDHEENGRPYINLNDSILHLDILKKK